jgi:hypothetical protein
LRGEGQGWSSCLWELVRRRRGSKIFRGIRKGAGRFWGSRLMRPDGFKVPSGEENLGCGALGAQIWVGAQGPKALNVGDLRLFASPSAKII